MSVELSLAGQVALVTGASRAAGIGSAICRLLARAGADVFFTYYAPYDSERPWGEDAAAPAALLAELRGPGEEALRRAAAEQADLADPSTPARLFDLAERALGPVDILINNATYDDESDLDTFSAEVLDRHYAVNVRGAALMCAEFARRFGQRQNDGRQDGERHPGGRIVNLVSGELLGPMPGNLPYVITKGAVDAMTITLSASLAPRGITVNAVDPGPTDTGWMPPALRAQLEQQAPLGRVGMPDDAARLILFLVSPLGGWVTGQILHSRGGF
jgi:3-oxoacyl-[acyl-carrier protein] reductase